MESGSNCWKCRTLLKRNEAIEEIMKQCSKHNDTPYITPQQLAERWQCSRSSVDRIARRAGFSRLCLGEGKNGIIRYLRKEVEAYEKKSLVQMT
jgi:hypothetical protein